MRTRPNEEELQDPANWEGAEDVEPTPRKARAVVSVSIGAEDLARIAEVAERLNMKLSEFIRTAALEKVEGSVAAAPTVSLSQTSALALLLDQLAPISDVGWPIEMDDDNPILAVTA
ncbi:MAG: ribbon-helix-helix protein, CopG family [Chloroflexi bacterium]|nr:ribbon-helix-helix protein, CopG family [Chloroflexota bacterium]